MANLERCIYSYIYIYQCFYCYSTLLRVSPWVRSQVAILKEVGLVWVFDILSKYVHQYLVDKSKYEWPVESVLLLLGRWSVHCFLVLAQAPVVDIYMMRAN